MGEDEILLRRPKTPRRNWLRFFVFVILLLAIQAIAMFFLFRREPEARIAFMSDRDGDFDIFIMELDGSEVTNLTNSDAAEGLPSWSVAEKSLAFLSVDTAEGVRVMQMDATGENQNALLSDFPILATIPVWSPDGKWLAIEAGSQDLAEIYLIDLNSSELLNATDNDAINRFPHFSPDGDKLLFTSNFEGVPALYLLDIQAQETSRLTDLDSANSMGSWSPDGDQIVFATNRDGDFEIYLMELESRESVRLTEALGFDGYPLWSPDGEKIAFLSVRDGNTEIYVMNEDGSSQVNLTNHSAQDSSGGDFAWSPDGSRILFQTDRDGNVEVYVIDVEGGELSNLTNNAAVDIASVWVR
jgi:TolB protein